MRSSLHDGEFTEVLVQSDEQTPLSMRTREDLLIPRILGPISGPDHVMTCPFQYLSCAAPYAGVEQ